MPARAGLLGTPFLWLAVVAALFASMAGAWAVSALDTSLVKQLIPWLLAGVALYTMLNRKLELTAGRQRIAPAAFAAIAGVALGFYDGFFGPGTGSFWTVAVVTLLGLDLRTATGYTKTANLASNVGALASSSCTTRCTSGPGSA